MTKKEKEIVANIRNQFTPISNFFKMREDVRKSDLRPEQKNDVYQLIDKEDQKAQERVEEIAKLLKELG